MQQRLKTVTPSIGVFLVAFDQAASETLALAVERWAVAAGLSVEVHFVGASDPWAATADARILVLGPGLRGGQGADYLERFAPSIRGDRCDAVIVLAAGDAGEAFQPWLDDGTLYYLSNELPEPEHLPPLIFGALTDVQNRDQQIPEELNLRISAAVQQVAQQTDLRACLRRLAVAAADLTGSTAGRCWLYSRRDDSLLGFASDSGEEHHASAVAGLSSFSLRTRQGLRTNDVTSDHRFDADVDRIDSVELARLMAAPILDVGGSSDPLGVLTTLREADATPYTESDLGSLSLLARSVAGILKVRVTESGLGNAQVDERLYRRSAIEHTSGRNRNEGRLLNLEPRWLPMTFRILVALVAVLLLVVGLASHSEYAEGPAVIVGHHHRLGRSLDSEDALRSRGDASESVSVIAFLPGHFAPRLRPGMPVDIRLLGFPSAAQEFSVSRVGTLVLGPDEARRGLPPEFADSISLNGPTILVEATSTHTVFTSRDVEYRYVDGMVAQAEVRLGEEPLLFALLPRLGEVL